MKMVFGASASSFGQFQGSRTSFGQSSSSAGHTFSGTATQFGPSMETSTFAGGSSNSGRTSSSFGGFRQTTGSTAGTISKGSSVASYHATQEVLGFDDTPPAGKIASLSAMPIYTHKSHEELRSEDYELKGKANIAFLPQGSQRPKAPMVSGSLTGEPSSGSRISTYAATQGYEEINNRHLPIIVQSISAMPIYNGKSHEELRFEDCEVNAKGVQTLWGNKSIEPSGTQVNVFTNPPISNTFNSNPPFAPFKSNPVAPSTNPFPPSTIPFAPQSQTFTTTTTPTISPNLFSPQSNPFTPQSQGFVTLNNSFFIAPTPATSSQSFVSTNGTTSTTPVIAPFINPFSSPTNPFTPQSQTLTTTTTPTPTISPNPFSPQSNPLAPQSQAFTTPNNSFFRASSPATSSQSICHNSIISPNPGPTATFSPSSTVTNIFGPRSQTAFTPTSTTTTILGNVISPNHFAPQSNPFAPQSQAFTTPNNSFFTASYPATSSQSICHNSITSPNPGPTATFSPFSTVTNIFGPRSQTAFTPTSTTTTILGNVISPNQFSPQTNPFTPPSQAFVNPTSKTTTTPEHIISPNPFSPQTNPFAPRSQDFFSLNSTTSMPSLTTNFNTNSCSLFTQLNPPNNFSSSRVSTISTVSPSIWSSSVTTLGPCTPVLNVSQPGQTSTTNPSQPSQGEGVGGQNMNEQQPLSSNVGMQPTVVANPFGLLSAVNASIIETEAVTSIPRGISSLPQLPVKNNSAPVRMATLFRIRHLSTRRVSLAAQRYNSASSGFKVPFFNDKEDIPCLAAPFLPRKNTRDWVMNKPSGQEHAPIDAYKKGEASREDKAGTNSLFQVNENYIKVNAHTFFQEEDLPVSGKLHDPLVSSLMLKLPSGGEYYTEPSIKELEAKERAEPGFCSHVKNFVVGRKDKGSIKFLGETDIRELDLESIVQFNDCEVIVHWDDGKKPPVGQGLNKPAEVTLLNVKCVGKTSGKQYSDVHHVHKLEKKLIKKATEQGAEFVSYNPVLGEWKFRVHHF